MSQDLMELTGKQEEAAALLALDEESDEAIAARLNVTRRTLARWKTEPPFQARVRQVVDALARDLQRYHIARKDKRIAEYDARWRALIQIRQERAADPELQDIPGASTGLVVERLKMIGTGPDAELVREYAVDTGTLSAQLALEKQASQEAGQWTEKQEHAFPDVLTVKHEHSFDFEPFRRLVAANRADTQGNLADRNGAQQSLDSPYPDA